jgi:hypothetical protein
VAGLQLENFVLPERELDFSCTVCYLSWICS